MISGTGMYERAGFKRMAEFDDWQKGRINVILCKSFAPVSFWAKT